VRILRLLAAVLVGAGLAYSGVLLWNSSLMELKRVEVAGNREVSKEELVDATRLKRGTHLVSISTENVTERVEALAWIGAARVERILPSTIRISVEERSPAAMVVAINGTYLIDARGVVLDEGTREVISIVDLTGEPVDPGSQLTLPQIDHVFQIMKSIDPVIRDEVKQISARSVDRITLHLKSDIRILFGAAENIPEKSFAAIALVRQAAAQGRQIEYMDVRVPDRPAVRYR
jgi:cell division protein FtsQ